MNKIDKTFHFTLVLNHVGLDTPELEDHLYKAGCDDALIHFRNGAVYLDFDRHAASFQDAVLSAIAQVESSPLHTVVASIAPENWVTESEMAKRLSLKR